MSPEIRAAFERLIVDLARADRTPAEEAEFQLLMARLKVHADADKPLARWVYFGILLAICDFLDEQYEAEEREGRTYLVLGVGREGEKVPFKFVATDEPGLVRANGEWTECVLPGPVSPKTAQRFAAILNAGPSLEDRR